ncbi:MFS transporter [bacterium AH-315-E10]|nr:MFS transporter [bacterium AH-315-E10]
MLSQQNKIKYVTGEGFWGVLTGLTVPSVILVSLLQNHNASKLMIGVVASGMSGAFFITSFFGLFFFTSRKKRKVQLVLWHLLVVSPMYIIIGILIFFSSSMSDVVFCWTLLALFILVNFFLGVIIPSWQDWIGHLCPKESRGSLMGLAFCVFNISWMVTSLIVSFIFRRDTSDTTYGLLYIAGGIAGMLSMVLFAIIDDRVDEHTEEQPKLSISEIKHAMKESYNQLNYRIYLTSKAFVTCGICMLPFYTLYYRSDLGGGLHESDIMSMTVVQVCMAALSAYITGRAGDKKGHRYSYIYSVLFIVLSLLVPIFSKGLISGYASFILMGLSGGIMVSHINIMLDTCTHDQRVVHLVLSNLIVGVFAVSIPILMGLMGDMLGIKPVFITALILTLIGILVAQFKMIEPRDILEAEIEAE